MLDQLLETKQARQRKPLGTLVSVILHVVVIAAVARMSARAAIALPTPTEAVVRFQPATKPAESEVRRHAERSSAQAPSTFPHPRFLPQMDIPVDIPPVNTNTAPITDRDFSTASVTRRNADGVPSEDALIPDGQSYLDVQVDKAAASIPGTPQPLYPEMLKSAGVEGEALVQFVVDTTGRAEPGSFKVLRATHDAFAEAVRTTLPRMRFLPAELHGQRVRMLVQQPFAFALSK